MLTWSLLVALLAALLAGTVTGLTGFGLALISTPLLLFVYEPRLVVVLTVFFSIFINIAVVWDSWREARRPLALALLLPSVVGVVLGAEVLRILDPIYIRLAVGAVVVLSALILMRDVRLPGAETRWGPVVAGSASGALSTSTGLAGPPIVLLLASRGLPKAEFRSTSALYFLAMSLVGLLVLAGRGLIEGGGDPARPGPRARRHRREGRRDGFLEEGLGEGLPGLEPRPRDPDRHPGHRHGALGAGRLAPAHSPTSISTLCQALLA